MGWIKRLLLLGVAGAALYGAGLLAKNAGEDVYKGELNGAQVRYEEGRWGPVKGASWYNAVLWRNMMVVDSGDFGYTFVDVKDPVASNWRTGAKPDKAELELIIERRDGKTRVYHRSDADDETPEGEKVAAIFKAGDDAYNRGRVQIVELKGQEFQGQYGTIVERLQGLFTTPEKPEGAPGDVRP